LLEKPGLHQSIKRFSQLESPTLFPIRSKKQASINRSATTGTQMQTLDQKSGPVRVGIAGLKVKRRAVASSPLWEEFFDQAR
jgi:hypothetical protein